ncbi:hypothetical protein FB451DRAFT_1412491 [Mycena latifolia]|nr:hypothetical protein FB451DRAFT_1412491 [Mycena latifolia]
MRFVSAIYISILSLAAVAAPLARGDAIRQMSRQDHDVPVLVARGGSDVFEELDLTARDTDVEVEVERRIEPPDDRGSAAGGCVIA